MPAQQPPNPMVLAAFIDAIHACQTLDEDAEETPKLQTSAHGRVDLRRYFLAHGHKLHSALSPGLPARRD